MNLNIFNSTNLFDAANNLFQQLGIELNSNTAEPLPVKDLLKQHYKDNDTFQAIDKTYFIGIIDDSIFQQTGLFDNTYSYEQAIDQGDKNYNGLMLFALELKKQPTRTEISELTRTFNRISQRMPVALLLKYTVDKEAVISIAISERFKYLQNWRQGEKAGKVIMLRDIHTQNTHAGHTRILLDLVKPAGVTNYAELHKRWLEVLDVDILNQRFYREIFNWYLWALKEVRFPQIRPEEDMVSDEVHQSESLIRLLTRLLFCWFMKEKGLINERLFDKNYASAILKSMEQNETTYYKAILQNLFFATLNKPIAERKVIDEGFNKKEYGDPLVYRYKELFREPDKLLSHFENIPFLNGGLFDCLDVKKTKETGTEIRLDGFSTRSSKQPVVPNKLFFGQYENIDLSSDYDDKSKNRITVKGILDIFSSYKFTIEESTPVEEEIALDPELLGKVFEELLASYNPETKTTARKQTGSFYTPREIVDYMVDESLLEYLKQNLKKSSPPFQGGVPEGGGGSIKNQVPEGGGGSKSSSPDLGEVSEGRRGLNNLPHLKTFRKELRNNLTPAEAKLWTLLKGKQLGRKFRRQFSVANYILDFYCPSENLAIELDGQRHFEATQAEYDAERDLFLLHTGIKVLRFENKWVWDNPEGLLEEIKKNFGWKAKNPSVLRTAPLEGEQLLETRLRDLLSYSETLNPFNETETKALIEAINNCKILDPACGSGAFPMGVLQRLIHILKKLDPDNKIWFEMVIANFPDYLQQEMRQKLQEEDWDYVRKLGIIKECIYGIDIQPIAIQISKLRFFISLLVDQKEKPGKPNRGFDPLPNLDFKLVAANALISAPESDTVKTGLFVGEVDEFEKEFKKLTGQYFSTYQPEQKKQLRARIEALINAKVAEKIRQIENRTHSDDEKVKTALKEKHKQINLQQEEEIKRWKSFANIFKNESVGFFETKYFFPQIKEGFDVVIGNPPYVSTKGVDGDFKRILEKYYGFADDLYNHFFFKGMELLKPNGTLSFISSKTFWTIQTKKNLRELILKNQLLTLFDTANPFESAMVDTCVCIIKKHNAAGNYHFTYLDGTKDLQKPIKSTAEISYYTEAPNQVFFPITDYNIKIIEKYGKKVNQLLNQWWEKISTSKNIEKHKRELEKYRQSLKPGDITLLGLITEGGQGLATANNGKYVGVLEGTKWAENVRKQRPEKLLLATQFCKAKNIRNKQDAEAFLSQLGETGIRKLFDELKEQYGRDVFGQGWLYRIVSPEEIADVETLTEDEKLNGIKGKKTFVPYDKGDKDGNRWYAPTPYYIDWSRENVKFLKENSGKKGEGMPVVRNPQFYFREGFCWNNVLSDEKIKCRMKDKSVHSTEAMTFISLNEKLLPNYYLVCMMNSTFYGNYRMIFINVSHHLTTGDAKEFPVIIPTTQQLKSFESIFNRTVAVQKQKFAGKISEAEAEEKLGIIQRELDEMVVYLYNT
jgi:very-short-patch-repair endonuclease